jgi:hypothetical protein
VQATCATDPTCRAVRAATIECPDDGPNSYDCTHTYQLIVRTVVERARATDAVPTVIAFDPHPRAVQEMVWPTCIYDHDNFFRTRDRASSTSVVFRRGVSNNERSWQRRCGPVATGPHRRFQFLDYRKQGGGKAESVSRESQNQEQIDLCRICETISRPLSEAEPAIVMPRSRATPGMSQKPPSPPIGIAIERRNEVLRQQFVQPNTVHDLM